MSKVIEAVYEEGVLRPLRKLDLPEGARVRVRIEGVYGFLSEWKVDAQKLKDELRSVHG
ncbi:MAG: antitoxin family protein [Aeropyrum sp.]|nr:antitoxin family protein [Aeropyrum sp.]